MRFLRNETIYKHRKVLVPTVCIVFVLLATNIVLAAIYRDDYLPFAKLNGSSIAGQDLEEVAATLDNSLAQSIDFAVVPGEVSVSATLTELGYKFEREAVEQTLLGVKAHSAPLVGLIESARSDVVIESTLDEQVLTEFIATQKIANDREPKGQIIEVTASGRVQLRDGRRGLNIDVAKTLAQIKQRIDEGAQQIDFVVSFSDQQETELINAEAALEQVDAVLSGDITVEAPESEHTIDRETLRRWLQITYQDNEASVGVDLVKLEEFVSKISEESDAPIKKTTITTLDGAEIERETSTVLESVDIETAVADIGAAITGSTKDTEVKLKPASATSQVTYNRTYSDTQAGLQSKISDWIDDHDGEYGVVVQQLDGDQWRGSYRASTPFVAASTYKLFVIYAVLDKVDSGDIKLSDTVANGMTVREAIADAIIYSGNESAIDLAEFYGGWDDVDVFIADNGFEATTTNNYTEQGFFNGDKKTTAADLANFLQRLNAGTLLSANSSKIMLEDMRKQIYRQGVNAGVDGAVASKVGFLEDYLHDAALVYGETDYVIVVLSRGSSWGDIADLAGVVDEGLE